MKILVANKDRTADLGSEIQRSARGLRQGRVPLYIAPEINALCLSKAGSEDDYLREFIRLLRYRDGLDTRKFDIPRKPGFMGLVLMKIKAFLWKLLRYQHDRIAFKQNLINGMLTSGLDFEMAIRERDILELKRRIAALEAGLQESTGQESQP